MHLFNQDGSGEIEFDSFAAMWAVLTKRDGLIGYGAAQKDRGRVDGGYPRQAPELST